MNFSEKMRAARGCLDMRLGISSERDGLAKAKDRSDCRVRLDRIGVTTSGISEDLILKSRKFRRVNKHFVWRKYPQQFLPYDRVSKFTSRTSICEMHVLTGRQMKRLAQCKITMIARDQTGLQPRDVMAVLDLLPDVRLVMVEIAFDFGFNSGVDGAYVRRHGLFGKSRHSQVASHRCYDSWGSRKGAKFVRSYYK
jgi:hypothetical protein